MYLDKMTVESRHKFYYLNWRYIHSHCIISFSRRIHSVESQLLIFSTLLLTRDLASNVRGGSRPRPRHGHHLPVRRGDVLLSAAEFAASYLPWQMAGVGVLALPKAMVGTGPAGFALIVYFTVNAMFAGSRLGMCWVMVTERFPEYLDGVGVTCHV